MQIPIRLQIEAIVEDPSLSRVDQLDALRQLARDAHQMSVASDEGMTGGLAQGQLLREVERAIAKLERR